MKKEHTYNLIKLAIDLIKSSRKDKVGKFEFDMEFWARNKNGNDLYPEDVNECGASCCAIGFWAARNPDKIISCSCYGALLLNNFGFMSVCDSPFSNRHKSCVKVFARNALKEINIITECDTKKGLLEILKAELEKLK